MKLRYKILGVLFGVLVVAVLSLAVALSHNSDCRPVPAIAADAPKAKAVVHTCYGPPNVLQLADIEKPEAGNDEMLIKVHSASVNPLDWHYMRGSPYFMRLGTGLGAPENIRLGVDFAGTVEAVGKNVKRFKPGDEVFGGSRGAFGEYLLANENSNLALKPGNVSFGEAASSPVAAITALQALRDQGKIKPGHNVLINGASGGVGTFAVQIAKSLGAEVTGVCSTRNLELVRSIGADHVIDYTREDYTKSVQHYDLIIDMVGNRSLLENRKVMTPQGRLVIVGGPKGNWFGPMVRPVKALLLSPFVDQDFGMILARLDRDDLEEIGQMIQDGRIEPVIDRHYPLDDIAEAIRYSEKGHARGKIIIDIE